MELSILVAKIISVIYLSVGLGAIFSTDRYRTLVDDMFDNTALTYFMGFTAVVVGLLLLHYHNVWVKDWTVLITIIGWLALLKGIILIVFPEFIQWYAKPIFAGAGFKIFPYVAILIGLFFAYCGFIS